MVNDKLTDAQFDTLKVLPLRSISGAGVGYRQRA
jgi:hypothetical protein